MVTTQSSNKGSVGASQRHRLAESKNGFTLVELLVVMVIIALLLSIVAPRYFASVDRAKEAALRTDLHVLRDAIDKRSGDRGTYPDSLDQLVSEGYIRAIPVDPITEQADSWVAVPYPDRSKPGVFDVHSGALGSGLDGTAYATW